jgi:hypothetical protein
MIDERLILGLENIEKIRRKEFAKAIIVYVTVVLLCAALYFFVPINIIIKLVIIFGACQMTNLQVKQLIIKPYRNSFKQEVMQPLLELFSKNLKYSFRKQLGRGEFVLSAHFPKIPRYLECTDTFWGNLDGFEITCYDLCADEEYYVYNPNRRPTDSLPTRTYFSGLFVVIDKAKKTAETISKDCDLIIHPGNKNDDDLNTTLSLIITQDSVTIESVNGQLQKSLEFLNENSKNDSINLPDGVHTIGFKSSDIINIQDAAFQEAFTSYCKAESGNRIIAKAAFRNKLLEVQRTWEKPICFSNSETRCYVAFSKPTVMFVPPFAKPLDREMEDKIKTEYSLIMSAISSSVALAKLTV